MKNKQRRTRLCAADIFCLIINQTGDFLPVIKQFIVVFNIILKIYKKVTIFHLVKSIFPDS